MRKIVCLLAMLLWHINAHAQLKDILTINVSVNYGGNALVLGKAMPLPKGDSIRFSTCKFYISGIKLLKKGQAVYTDKMAAHLIDIEAPNTLHFSFDVPSKLKYDMVAFNLGIDSATNVSGAMPADLDPTKGMYWTWQSGYINVKMEGSIKPAWDKSSEFEYHLGGYQQPYYAMQRVTLKLKEPIPIYIVLDVFPFFNSPETMATKRIMSPGIVATTLSQLLAKCFSVK